MSEEMRASFEECVKETECMLMVDEDTAFDIFRYAYKAALQESEAGAVEEVAYKDAPAQIWLNLGDCTAEEIAANNAGWNGLTEVTWCESKMDQFDIPYVRADLAPQSAQAIETAAIMRAVEAAEEWRKSEDDRKLSDAIVALIPQDGRTQLEQKCMEVANAAFDFGYYDCESPAVDCVEPKLRAIVTNLIGASK